VISYIGGKSRIAPKLIIPNIPMDIENFIEVFGGMFWCFFNMDLKKFPNLKNVVYNDSNPLNYNLFKCLQ
jgi:site-specific DNA-adenine methylase